MHVDFSLLTMLDMLMKRTSVNAGGSKFMTLQSRLKNLAILQLVEKLENSDRLDQLNIHIFKSLNLHIRGEAILVLCLAHFKC